MVCFSYEGIGEHKEEYYSYLSLQHIAEDPLITEV